MPHYRLREHRSGEVLWQRAREFHAEIPPKAIHHYPAGMSMKIERDIEEIVHRFYQDDPYCQYHLGAYQNPLPYPGGQSLQGPGPRQAAFLDMAQRQIQAAEPDLEMHMPLAGTSVPKPIFLRDEEGSAIHFLYLTFSNPAPGAADRGAAALATAQA